MAKKRLSLLDRHLTFLPLLSAIGRGAGADKSGSGRSLYKAQTVSVHGQYHQGSLSCQL